MLLLLNMCIRCDMSGLLPFLKEFISQQRIVSDTGAEAVLSQLYSDEAVVSTVFQQLGDIEKSFVMRTLLLDRPIKEQLCAFWTVSPAAGINPKSIYEPSLKSLQRLGIFVEHKTGSESSFDLHPGFRSCLIACINRVPEAPSSSVWTVTSVSTDQRQSAPSVGETKWHTLLERVITPSTQAPSGSDVESVILRLGFNASPPPPNAYKFILSDVTEQLWILLSEFISAIEKREEGGASKAVEIIQTVCGLMVIPKQSSFDLRANVSPLIRRAVQFLDEVDCVRSPEPSNPFQKPEYAFGPTASALHHSDSSQDLLIGAKLIVDSNMHVTAYTRSTLQVKLIALFCQVHRLLGTVLTGVLTRASVQSAIDSGGVNSDSIIRFLSSNLHPACGGKLPLNVANQIRLWEADCPRKRLRLDPCVTLTWRGDRTEQANSAIAQIKQLADSNRGLLFVKKDPDGRVYMGIKTSAFKSIFRQA